MSRPERTASWPRTMPPVLAIAGVYVAALAGLLVARSVLPDGVVVTALVGVWLVAESLLALLALARLRTIVRTWPRLTRGTD